MTASAWALRSCKPLWACAWRRSPSKSKGRVIRASTRAPLSRAIRAKTGAAPVPVPPPRPARRKRMSAPAQKERIFSTSSSAAARPTAGSPPAPRPWVRLAPRTNLAGVAQASRAWESVLTARNSTSVKPAWQAKPAALQPAPPRPKTLRTICFLRAGSAGFSTGVLMVIVQTFPPIFF